MASLTSSGPRYNLSPQESESAAAAGAGKPGAMPAGPPPMSSSPDAIACYEAARVAAAGGYTGVLPLGGAALPTPRTSGESTASGAPAGDAEELSAPAPVAEPVAL